MFQVPPCGSTASPESAGFEHRKAPRKCPIEIDANALNRDGTSHDELVDRLLELDRVAKINLIIPTGVRTEVQDPRTPAHVSELMSKIFTIKTGLTTQEADTRRRIEAALQGNAKPGKHAADAQHLAEIEAAGERARVRFLEFFTANIRNPNTRRAYARACARFFAWCDGRGLTLATIRTHDVAT